MQDCKSPYFFLTNTTALHHALWLGQIVPNSSISWRWLWTFSTRGRGICLNCSLKGVSCVTLIVCSIDSVQSNSTGSNENTLWYLAKSWWAASTSSGGQESNPRKSSSSNNFPCFCLTVNLGVWGSWGLFLPPATGPPLVVLAQGLLPMPWPMGFLLEGLGVSCTVPYHHDCILTTLSQLRVHTLYSKALWLRTVSSP